MGLIKKGDEGNFIEGKQLGYKIGGLEAFKISYLGLIGSNSPDGCRCLSFE